MSQVPTPLLSVIIPTHRRPHFLSRAIKSALEAVLNESVEVIVVPNGTDESWKTIAERYKGNTQVKWLPIEHAHACAARNHGMHFATSKYIRFLDDDDFIYPETLLEQINILETHDADICSGDVHMSNDSGKIIGVWPQPDKTDDFTAAICSNHRMQQPTAHILRLDVARTMPWDETLPYSQDLFWFLDLVASRELKWVRIDKIVGCWHRHTNDRISSQGSLNHRRQMLSERLIKLASTLDEKGRLTTERRSAIATGVWEQIHKGFCFAPFHWTKTSKWARTFQPGSHPPIALYKNKYLRKANPLFFETLIAPARLSVHMLRYAQRRLKLNKHW